MSKSTGNFLTIEDAIAEYSADAVRIALADAGDTNEFANFSRKTADGAVLKLFQMMEWAKSALSDTTRTDGNTAADRIFAATLDRTIIETDKAMNGMCFRDALKEGYFDLTNARDAYRNWSNSTGGMRKDLVERYVRIQAVLMAPIAPHVAENLWEVVGGEGLCCNASWPEVQDENWKQSYLAGRFITKFVEALTSGIDKQRSGKKVAPADHCHVFVAKDYHDYQKATLKVLKNMYDAQIKAGAEFPPPIADFKMMMKEGIEKAGLEKKQVGVAMGFGDFTVKNMTGPESFADEFPFDQMDFIEGFRSYIVSLLKVQSLEILDASSGAPDPKKVAPKAKPGEPQFYFN